MTNKKTSLTCALCNLPVTIKGFSLKAEDGEINFCCGGCQSIYELLNADKLTPSTKTKTKRGLIK
ncbi:heavy metal translocating P-type ATPase metal-binding domain-containing protein [Methylicorpusculum oleiharenae]|uniref:heavy metal translocating P-type ATPase metal-binding domain-containing protein n=1 Tax=Methylicorpusculum oleiharenae TaxID=1338687 RepID=UPI00135955B0|nr:heavy metal translocating P-type ATPase metal-binding domain-containing protein [Methylicorpusculum oleiharenae]